MFFVNSTFTDIHHRCDYRPSVVIVHTPDVCSTRCFVFACYRTTCCLLWFCCSSLSSCALYSLRLRFSYPSIAWCPHKPLTALWPFVFTVLCSLILYSVVSVSFYCVLPTRMNCSLAAVCSFHRVCLIISTALLLMVLVASYHGCRSGA